MLSSILGAEDYTALAVSHQFDDFKDDMVAAIDEIRNYNYVFDVDRTIGDGGLVEEDKRTLERSGLVKLISDRIGAKNVVFRVRRTYGYNASTISPTLDKNHVLEREGLFIDSSAGVLRNRLSELDRKYVAGVDLKKVKLYGDIANEPLYLHLGEDLLKDPEMPSEAIAGIIAHEIGHFLSYVVFMGKTLRMTYALAAVMQTFNSGMADKQRVELLEVALPEFGKDAKDAVAYSKINSGEVVIGMLTSQNGYEKLSMTNSIYYDIRNCEVLADTVAVKLGFGGGIAKGLGVLYNKQKYVWVYILRNYVLFIWQSLRRMATGPIATFIMLAKGLSFIFDYVFLATPKDLYDPPKARLVRVRQTLIESMKDDKLTRDQARSVGETLKEINDVLAEVNAGHGLRDRVHSLVNMTWRGARAKENAFKELESISNNELFVRTNALKGANQ